MRTYIPFAVVVATLGLAMLLTACEEKGPAEKAGAKIDQAVEETKEEMKQAKEYVEKKVDPSRPAEKAGEKIDQAVEETKEEVKQAKEKVEDTMKQ